MIQAEIMVVALAVLELHVRIADARTNGRSRAEIEGRTGNGPRRLRQRNRVGIDCEKTVGDGRQPVAEDVRTRRAALQIEKTVIGQVDDGGTVRPCLEAERQFGWPR